MKKNILFLTLVLFSPLLTTSTYGAQEENPPVEQNAPDVAATEEPTLAPTTSDAPGIIPVAEELTETITPIGDIVEEEVVVPVTVKDAATDAAINTEPPIGVPAEKPAMSANLEGPLVRTKNISQVLADAANAVSPSATENDTSASTQEATQDTTPTPTVVASTAKVDQTPEELAATIAADQTAAQASLNAAEADLKAGEADLQKVKEETKFNWKNSMYLKWLVPVLIVLFLLYLAYATSSGSKDEDEDRNRHYQDPSSCRDNGTCK